jgi:hypothetical protein
MELNGAVGNDPRRDAVCLWGALDGGLGRQINVDVYTL